MDMKGKQIQHTEGKGNPYVHRLLLVTKVKEFLINKMESQVKEEYSKYMKDCKMDIGFDGERMTNDVLMTDDVKITLSDRAGEYAVFGINKEGDYYNNGLNEENLQFILNLADMLKYKSEDEDKSGVDTSDWFLLDKLK